MDARRTTEEAFREFGVEADVVSFIVENTPPDAQGLLLYGSRARGDFLPESDFDIIFLVAEPRRSIRGVIASLSYYTAQQLVSASETLFGTHLIRDGITLWETDSLLTDLLAQIHPASPSALLDRVRELSVVLDQAREQANERPLFGQLRLARYLLRTAIYAQAMADGQPCFSVRELATRFGDPALEALLASDPGLLPEPSVDEYNEIRTRLERLIGPLPRNPWGSIEKLIVEMWDVDRVLAAVAVRTLSNDESPFDYADLPKVVL